MKVIAILLGYLKWHYSRAIFSLVKIWRNFLFFLLEFFSLKLLIKNLLDPWKRMTDPYPKTFSFKSYLFSFITNSITRVVGIVMRLGLLIIGVVVVFLFCLALPIFISLWLILPLLILFMAGVAIYLIIK